VLFYTLTPSGELDVLSVHGGCPVLSGTKVIAQQWIRENRMYQPFETPTFEAYWFVSLLKCRTNVSQPNVASEQRGL